MRGWMWGAVAGLLLAHSQTVQAGRSALLVGVSQYRNPGLRLEGPAHDVAALREVLMRRWGFAAGDIRTLTDAQATRAAILAELEQLNQRSGAGDEVFIYFSGHGSSALSPSAGEMPVPHGSGAFLAHDFEPGTSSATGMVVGRTDLVPRLQALERGQRNLWVVMDSCYSGQAVRQVVNAQAGSTSWPVRSVETSMAPASRAPKIQVDRPAPPPYPYRSTAFLSAAAEGETAKDVSGAQLQQWPTWDGKPHGALTDALLRVLDGRTPGDLNGDGLLDLHEVHRSVADFMARRPYGHTPQRLPSVSDDAQGLGARPVLSARGAAVAPALTAPAPLSLRAQGLAPELLSSLAGLPGVRLVDQGPADLNLHGDGVEIDVVDAAGDRVNQLPASQASRLVGQVGQLAWAQRLRALAARHRRGVLPVDIEPDGYGGNLMVGQEVNFALRPQAGGWLVMVNIASDGRITPLYPKAPYETRDLPAGQMWRSPRQRVSEPEGKDLQFMFLFDRQPADLVDWSKRAYGAATGTASDSELDTLKVMLERMLIAEDHRFVSGHTEFRTWLQSRAKR